MAVQWVVCLLPTQSCGKACLQGRFPFSSRTACLSFKVKQAPKTAIPCTAQAKKRAAAQWPAICLGFTCTHIYRCQDSGTVVINEKNKHNDWASAHEELSTRLHFHPKPMHQCFSGASPPLIIRKDLMPPCVSHPASCMPTHTRNTSAPLS